MSSNNRLTEQRQNTVDSCIKTEISKIGQEERAQHSEQLENLLVLLKENMILWEQKDDLQNRKENLCFEVDQLRENLNKVDQEVSGSKKVSGERSDINLQSGGIQI